MELSLIIAQTNDNIIGSRWNIDNIEYNDLMYSKQDKEHFKLVTQFTPNHSQNLLIVGRKTWETLPNIMKNCKHRKFLLLTKNKNYKTNSDNCFVYHDRNSVLEFCIHNKNNYHKIFIIGGAEIYDLFLSTGFVTEIFITYFNMDKCNSDYQCENLIRYMVSLSSYNLIKSSTIIDNVTFKINKNCELNFETDITFFYFQKLLKPFELQYINLMNLVINYGSMENTRNGITRSLKDQLIKIDLNDGFPILTTRKIYWKGLKEELLWFISGKTDVKILQKKGVNIWNDNSTRFFLDQRGLKDLPEYDIGPSYGFQFRHAGENYIDCNSTYYGFDQLENCINEIKNNPTNRRIIINLWDVKNLNRMALPPCALLYQFSVTNSKLSCHLYQRSWDMTLGWNTGTAALLTCILADFCNLKLGTLTHTICDLHIYESHIEKINEFIFRIPFNLPKLIIKKKERNNISDYLSEDLMLENYQSHPAVSMKMIA